MKKKFFDPEKHKKPKNSLFRFLIFSHLVSFLVNTRSDKIDRQGRI